MQIHEDVTQVVPSPPVVDLHATQVIEDVHAIIDEALQKRSAPLPLTQDELNAPFLPGWQLDPAEVQRYYNIQRQWGIEHAGTFKSPQEYMDFLKSTEPQPEPPAWQHLQMCPHLWQFQLNNNHTAIKGCRNCGLTYGTIVAGDTDTLQWHHIKESEE